MKKCEDRFVEFALSVALTTGDSNVTFLELGPTFGGDVGRLLQLLETPGLLPPTAAFRLFVASPFGLLSGFSGHIFSWANASSNSSDLNLVQKSHWRNKVMQIVKLHMI